MEHFVNKEVKFNDNAKWLDVNFARPGMMATVVSARDVGDDCWEFKVDYSKFEDYNRAFEVNDYICLETREYTLSAREADCYIDIETLYVDVNEPIFDVADHRISEIHSVFEKSGETDYVKFLENHFPL